MKPKDIFGIIVRTAGLVCLGYGSRYALSWIFLAMKQNPPEGWNGSDYVIIGVAYLTIGVFLLRGGQHVAEFAYPKRDDKKDPKTPDDAA